MPYPVVTTKSSPSPITPEGWSNEFPFNARMKWVMFKGGPMNRPPTPAFVPPGTEKYIVIFPPDKGSPTYTSWASDCQWRYMNELDPTYTITIKLSKV